MTEMNWPVNFTFASLTLSLNITFQKNILFWYMIFFSFGHAILYFKIRFNHSYFRHSHIVQRKHIV
jgi:hypothetical protein